MPKNHAQRYYPVFLLSSLTVVVVDATILTITGNNMQQLKKDLHTLAIAAFMMSIAGACPWISPYLAHHFSMGQIYEGVSAAMSQFAAMVIRR
ncbi:MAG: hypothetical protein C5B55_10670 [Blastocatellia bacterium]|nr:MAG: hypothetical protein C5B55_10670 [Blastocatellia bacterium]